MLRFSKTLALLQARGGNRLGTGMMKEIESTRINPGERKQSPTTHSGTFNGAGDWEAMTRSIILIPSMLKPLRQV
ncbi:MULTISPECIES: hypothetical protein [Bradyrhizobium]|jgi:hypothetical protein|uniref:hypothetical protein n=1 Tax=Bradyrhizobium TaxID=374 RepID=UPI002168EDAF|nr:MULTISPECIES: hypothetical protein [Bradyrhizobium]MCS3931940.1 hypothetical protein [Bradyrhizobium elkanii]MCS3972498.1 hypothetical protein [Bradyrhizobium japonicum]